MTTVAFRIFAVVVSGIPVWLFVASAYANCGRSGRSWIRSALFLALVVVGAWILYAAVTGELSEPTTNTFQEY